MPILYKISCLKFIRSECNNLVPSKVPTPLHSIHAVDQARRKELEGHLAYLEGCYGGLPTLQATNLWKSLSTPEEVNRLVSLWILTLHKNVRFQYKVIGLCTNYCLK